MREIYVIVDINSSQPSSRVYICMMRILEARRYEGFKTSYTLLPSLLSYCKHHIPMLFILGQMMNDVCLIFFESL